MKSTWTSIDND